MDLVDEQDVAAFQACQQPIEHALMLHRGAAGDDEVDAHFVGEHVCQRGLAQPRGAA